MENGLSLRGIGRYWLFLRKKVVEYLYFEGKGDSAIQVLNLLNPIRNSMLKPIGGSISAAAEACWNWILRLSKERGLLREQQSFVLRIRYHIRGSVTSTVDWLNFFFLLLFG
jgi:hypothetical protein